MELQVQFPRKEPTPGRLMLIFAVGFSLTTLLLCSVGCTPAEGQGGHAIDAVEVAHAEARLMSNERPAPEPDPWPDMPEEVRSGIVSDAMAGVDPRLVDVEERLASVEERVDKHDGQFGSRINVMVELADRVDVLENMPKAPTPTVDELAAVRTDVDKQEERLAALIAKLNGCKCGPDCTCGPDCKCPDGCDPDCPCQKATASRGTSRQAAASDGDAPAKPYASITMLSLPGCPPCEQWKRDVLPRLLELNWAFSEETLTSGRAPRFGVCIGDACYIHQGFMTGSDLAAIVRRHNGEPEPVKSRAAVGPVQAMGLRDSSHPRLFEGPGFFGQGIPLFGRRGG